MGGLHRRKPSASLISRLARLPMLRQLDPRWKVFRFPSRNREHNHELGYAGEGEPVAKNQRQAGPVDYWTDEHVWAGSEPGWETAFRRRSSAACRDRSLQLEIKGVCSISSGHFCRRT